MNRDAPVRPLVAGFAGALVLLATLLPAAPAAAAPWLPKLLVAESEQLAGPAAIAVGPDGAVWVANNSSDEIVRLDDASFAGGGMEPIDTSGAEAAAVAPEPFEVDFDVFSDVDGEVDAPADLVVGGSGDVFFTSSANDRLGRLDPDTGEITTYEDVDGEVDFPASIAVAPDGNVWFTSLFNDRIGRLQPNGNISTLTHPDVEQPGSMVAGPDGGIWFTSIATDRLARVDPTTGTITTFTDPALNRLNDLTVGPDGRLWFAMGGASTQDGAVGAFDIDTETFQLFSGAPFIEPIGLTSGPDGNLWVSDGRAGLIRLSTAGATTPILPDDVGLGQIDGLVAGPPLPGFGDEDVHATDGAAAASSPRLWLIHRSGDAIASLDTELDFGDVDLDHPFVDEIGWMAATGVSTGYPDETYRPSAVVTRQAMSAFMYRLANLRTGRSGAADGATAGSFSDVSENHPFYDEIEWMAAEGISTGYPDGTYRPGAVVTRQAMSAFMFRLFQLAQEPVSAAGADDAEPAAADSFSDVSENHPFYDEIEWMAAEGISTGYPDGTYRPAIAVSRQAMSAFMFRLAPLLHARGND